MREFIYCLIGAVVMLIVCYLIGWAEIELFHHPTGVMAPAMAGCLTYGMGTMFIIAFVAWMVIENINEIKKS